MSSIIWAIWAGEIQAKLKDIVIDGSTLSFMSEISNGSESSVAFLKPSIGHVEFTMLNLVFKNEANGDTHHLDRSVIRCLIQLNLDLSNAVVLAPGESFSQTWQASLFDFVPRIVPGSYTLRLSFSYEKIRVIHQGFEGTVLKSLRFDPARIKVSE